MTPVIVVDSAHTPDRFARQPGFDSLLSVICLSAVALSCSDVDTIPPDAPALFTTESPQLERGSLADTRLARRTLRLVDNTGHIQLPGEFVLNLSEVHRPSVRLERHRRHDSGYDVWSARVEDPRFANLVRYDSAVFVVNRQNNELYGTVDIADSVFEIRPDADGYTVEQTNRFNPDADCGFDHLDSIAPDLETATAPALSQIRLDQQEMNEQDECGTYILDVFFGFTQSAAAVLGDIEAHALMLTETANSGLSNSGIDDVRLESWSSSRDAHVRQRVQHLLYAAPRDRWVQDGRRTARGQHAADSRTHGRNGHARGPRHPL